MRLSLKKLEVPVADALSRVGRIAQKEGVRIYLVGGMVRDLYLGKRTCDVDLVMEGDAIAFADMVLDRIGGNMVKHPSFGTATIELTNGLRLDFVTARKEIYQQPGALPKVKKGDMHSDAFRRDFTINALAMSLDPNSFGEVLDHTGGLADLESQCIRVLHENSFVDDPTRIFRAARYEQRYNFRINRQTLGWIKDAIENGAFETISKQRYKQEIDKVFSEVDPAKVLLRLNQWGVFDYLSPGIVLSYARVRKVSQQIGSAEYPGDWDSIFTNCLFWFALFSGCGASARREVLGKMPFTKVQQKFLGSAEDLFGVSQKIRQKMRASQVVRCFQGVSEEGLCYLWIMTQSHYGKMNIQTYFATRGAKLIMTGNDLRSLGIKSGARIGEILDKVLEIKLDKGGCTKAQELQFARAIINGEGSGVRS